jgi:hypothetical protein
LLIRQVLDPWSWLTTSYISCIAAAVAAAAVAVAVAAAAAAAASAVSQQDGNDVFDLGETLYSFLVRFGDDFDVHRVSAQNYCCSESEAVGV